MIDVRLRGVLLLRYATMCGVNSLWLVCDGRRVKFWIDNWVPNLGPLWLYGSSSEGINREALVCDIVTNVGEWD